jgi:hypothetical protein
MLRGAKELEAIIATSLGALGEKDFDWRRREKLYAVIGSAETEEDVDSDEGDE